MDVIDHGRALGETPDIRRLREQSDEVQSLVVELADKGARGADEVRPLVGLGALVGELRRLEPLAQRTSRVLQPDYSYDPEDPGVALVQRAEARGVEQHLITAPHSLRTHPLLSSIFPRALTGPVFLRAMIIDESAALVGGRPDAFGNRVSWSTRSPEVIGTVLDLWRATVPHCKRVLEADEDPPLTRRQLDVAKLLCTGEKDKSIARILDLSARTVEREVSAILRMLKATSRTEAVLLMRGRGVNGGWSETVDPVGP